MNKKVGMKLENVTGKNITPEIDEQKIQRMFGEQEEMLKFLSEFRVDEELFAKVVIERDALKFLLQGYKDLEEQGRLIKLPCKVGDTVYKISKNAHTSFRHIDKTTVVRIAVDKDGLYLFCARCSNAKTVLGKTVFLTREEAERKLKGEDKQE